MGRENLNNSAPTYIFLRPVLGRTRKRRFTERKENKKYDDGIRQS